MACKSRNPSNKFNFLRFRRVSNGALVSELPIRDLCPIQLVAETIAAPTNLVATTLTGSRIDLTWTDNANNEVQFQIERSTTSGSGFAQIATVGPNVESFQDSGLTNNTTYYYRVRAVSASINSDYSNEANATTLLSFASTWNTANAGSSSSTEVTLPLITLGNYNFIVEWGDGSFDTITSHNQAEVTHTYSTSGTYNIEIVGTLQGWSFNNGGDAQKLTNISQWSIFQPSGGGVFYGCTNLNVTATDAIDLTQTTTLTNFFRDCASLTTPNLSGWSTAAITNMSNTFSGCSNFNSNIGAWNTSLVTTFNSMFLNCALFNQNLPDWNVSTCQDFSSMFSGCSMFDGTLTNWATTSATNLSGMFLDCSVFNQPVNQFTTTSVTTLSQMFFGCSNFNQSVSSWNVASVSNMASTFRNCTSFNQDLNTWTVTALTNMAFTFSGCSIFNGNVDNWSTSLVTTMSNAFAGCAAFNRDITGWTVSSVISFSAMFSGCTTFNRPLDSWSVTATCTDINNMFSGCTAFAPTTLNSWVVSNVTNMVSTFRNCTNFNGNITGWNTGSCTQMAFMFQNCSIFNQNISTWDVIDVTNFSSMFQNCGVFNQNLGSWTTTSLEDISNMFNGAIAFEQNLSSWNISNLTNAAAFLEGVTLTTANYDALLVGWEAGQRPAIVTFSGGNSTYTLGSAAETARMTLESDGWSITDGGGV